MAISRALHQGEDSLLERSAASCRFLGTRETAKTQKRWLPKLQKTFLSILPPQTHRHTGTHTHKAPDAEMDSELLIQPISVSPSPGAVLVLHSLLLEFPLAMVFAEQLLTYSVGETIERSEDELDTVPTSVLIQVVELQGRDQQPDPVVPTSRFIELKTLLVSNLHPMVTEQQLIEKFGALGSISTVQVCRNNIISPAYAFVTFHHRRDAVRAQKALNFTDLLNKPLIIMWGPDKTIEVLSDNDSSSPRQTEERETAGETEERKTSGETERKAAGDTEERKTSGETEREAAGDTEERKTSKETEREAAGDTEERANSESSWGRRISNNVKSAVKAAVSSPAAWVGVGIGVCAAYAYFRSRS